MIERCVRGNDSRKLVGLDEPENFLDLRKFQIRRDLEQKRFGGLPIADCRLPIVGLLHFPQQLIERRFVLQFPQARRVRRTDVEHKIISE